MGCGESSEDEETGPRAERARVTPDSSKVSDSTSHRNASTKTGHAPTSTPSKDIGRSFQGPQLGTKEFQSKSYTERKHLEELEFKKALKHQEQSKAKEPTIKEREQEIVAAAGSQMFDLSLLTERPDEEELEEKRRQYEEALSRVTLSAVSASAAPLLTTISLGEPIVASLSNRTASSWSLALRSAFESMRVTAMRDALVDELSPLP